jgi:hypothetical protein
VCRCLLSDKLPERSTVLNAASARHPLVVALKFHTELIIIDPQIAVAAACHRFWRDLRDLLGDHPDIRRVAAAIAEAIKAEAIAHITEKNDVMFQPDIRTPSTATAAAASATTAASAATAHCGTTAAAGACTHGAASTATADVCVLSSASTMRRSRARAWSLTAAVRGSCSLARTVALADIGSAAARLVAWFRAGARPVAWFGTGAWPVARFVAGSGSIPGLGARIEHLLATIAAEVTLTSISGILPMIDPGLPPIAAAGAADRMRGSIPWRRDVDVVTAAAPIDVAAPIPA